MKNNQQVCFNWNGSLGQAHIRLMLAKTMHFTILLVIAYNVCLSSAHVCTHTNTQGWEQWHMT